MLSCKTREDTVLASRGTTDSVDSFFKYPYYDEEVLQYAEKTKQPSGILENPSIGKTNLSSPAFEGPVLVCRRCYLALKILADACVLQIMR